ncbi:transporter [Salinimicrobium tongyeongense]|jgi:putative transport protein|uniref:Transporter n=1 Tax=Salinimicrobium tongyeongense TaxID=2809707 RepID=A0ABY6NVA7_9FLAO|nr:aspartate:alanine exchanger family transporter [Salinimicrobium tongyeongense]UZH56476.1 transporter [Salinimicrobium tongyeongense]
MSSLLDFLSTDYVALFIIIGIGIILGKASYKGLSLDTSAVIFVAMFYGYAMFSQGVEFAFPGIIQQIGLLLFIFTIGMQAGPTFFEVYKSQGRKLISMAFLTVLAGALTTLVLALVLDIDYRISVGLFSGALTSTPGLAAAIEATGSSLASIGYGIAYPFGVIGVILFVRLAPKIFATNMAREEQKYIEETQTKIPEVGHKNFMVTNENANGKTIRELDIRMMTKANISRVMRANETSIPPAADLVLRKGDVVRAVGTSEALKKVELLLGNPTDIEIPESGMFEVRWYVISKRNVVNKTLGELNLRENYKATVTRIRRAGIDLPARPSVKLRFGDRLFISSTRGNVNGLSLLFGDSMKEVETTSFLPVALGILIGLMIGAIEVPLPVGSSFSLGLTGGVLLAALILSRIGKTGPILWNLPGTGNHILRQFGLLLFLIPVGLSAGSQLGPTIQEYGLSLFAIGAAITLIPMIIVVLVARIILKMNFLSVLGALTGGMTSTPGLSAVDSMTSSEGPQVAYATVYPFALVAIIIFTQVLSYIL